MDDLFGRFDKITDEQPFSGLHVTLKWEPYLHVGDGYKVVGYRREDGAGYVLPLANGEWWATWAHPMMCGRPGWHHHALGNYPSQTSAAFAFDTVFDLERIAGNKDRTGRYERVAA